MNSMEEKKHKKLKMRIKLFRKHGIGKILKNKINKMLYEVDKMRTIFQLQENLKVLNQMFLIIKQIQINCNKSLTTSKIMLFKDQNLAVKLIGRMQRPTIRRIIF